MSGGSLGYIYESLENYLQGEMEDEVLNRMIDDLIPLTHALEWWKSADWSEEQYRELSKEFKDKWLNNYDELKIEIINDIKQRAIKEIEEL